MFISEYLLLAIGVPGAIWHMLLSMYLCTRLFGVVNGAPALGMNESQFEKGLQLSSEQWSRKCA